MVETLVYIKGFIIMTLNPYKSVALTQEQERGKVRADDQQGDKTSITLHYLVSSALSSMWPILFFLVLKTFCLSILSLNSFSIRSISARLPTDERTCQRANLRSIYNK